jgi:hypothetical protein
MTNLFNNTTNITDKGVIFYLEDSMKMFLDYAFLQIGGFINVNRPTTYSKNNDGLSRLNRTNDPTIQNRVWESVKKDWVYETEIQFNNISPNSISGIYVNDSFLPGPTGIAPNSYKINYPEGRIIFDKLLPDTTSVELDYSYRYVQVYKSENCGWFRELQSSNFTRKDFEYKGDNFITSNHRIQMPCIVMEMTPRTILIPYELGNISNIINQDVLLYVISENASKRKEIVEKLLIQKDNTFNILDTNNIAKSNKNDLLYDGQKNPERSDYGQFSENDDYIKNRAIIKNTTITEFNTITDSLYLGIVRWTIEIFP